jgi:phosphoglycerate-specific signal transduction histidine kinase
MKPGNKPLPANDHEAVILDLRQELAARVAEADWLKARYEAELRAALASRPVPVRATLLPQTEVRSDHGADAEKVKRLQADLDRALAAETRYLDRIEELKDQVERLTKGGSGS